MKAPFLLLSVLLPFSSIMALPADEVPAVLPGRILTASGHPADEAFFPMAVWLQDPRNAPRYQAAGINLYVGLWKGPTEPQLETLTKTGMPVICDQSATGLAHRSNPIIAAWMHGDEPDNAQALPGGKGYGPPILPEAIVQDYTRLREADPSRPVLLNLGQGVAFDNYIGRGVRRNHPEDYASYLQGCDIASFDIYPVVHQSQEVSGKLEFVARGVERLTQWTEGKKPVWNCIECTDIDGIGRKATPAQVRSEIWMALIRGSRGLIYFVHQFKPVFKESALLSDPEMLTAVTAINRQIKELAPFLNGPSLPDALTTVSSAAGSPVIAVLKESRGTTCVFAVNLTPEPTTAAFTLKNATATRARVLEESRQLEVADRTFKDSFAPYAVHLYRLE